MTSFNPEPTGPTNVTPTPQTPPAEPDSPDVQAVFAEQIPRLAPQSAPVRPPVQAPPAQQPPAAPPAGQARPAPQPQYPSQAAQPPGASQPPQSPGAQPGQAPQARPSQPPQTPPLGQQPQSAPAAQAGQMRLEPHAPQTTPPAASQPAAPRAAAPAAPPSAPRPPGANQGSPGQRVGSAQSTQDQDLDVIDALRRMSAMGASDLHLTAGSPPVVRLDGKLTPLSDYDRLESESLQRSLYSLISQAQREKFEENLELDFSRAIPGEARFRVNMYRQRDSVGAVFRLIPFEIKPLESLGIPEVVSRFADLPRGLVLVTGPTGSGKSTTLASLIDLANRNRSAHIVTVEDPIEFLHQHKRSLVNQREVGADTHSFGNALRHVLRQDPDIILIGELRDLETIQVALTAAETGHLVFATLHTQDAAQTIDRMIDVFPGDQQGQIRTQLATAIQGVVCQTLLRRGDGPGRAVAVEVMMATPAIRNLIREGKTHQIYTTLQAGSAQGMQSMDQHLADLVKAGTVPYDVAAEVCHSVEEFNRLSGRFGN